MLLSSSQESMFCDALSEQIADSRLRDGRFVEAQTLFRGRRLHVLRYMQRGGLVPTEGDDLCVPTSNVAPYRVAPLIIQFATVDHDGERQVRALPWIGNGNGAPSRYHIETATQVVAFALQVGAQVVGGTTGYPDAISGYAIAGDGLTLIAHHNGPALPDEHVGALRTAASLTPEVRHIITTDSSPLQYNG